MSSKPAPAKVNGGPNKGLTTDEVKEQLYASFNEALNKTKTEVKQMQDKLKEYDEKFQASETMRAQGQKASDYFKSTLDEIKVTLDTLSEKAHAVFVEAKELSTEFVEKLWKEFKDAVAKLNKMALEFDQKYQVSQQVSELMAPLLENLKKLGANFDQAGATLKGLGLSGRNYIIGTAASLEKQYQIESRLGEIDEKFKISATAKTLQERGEQFMEKQHIMERVQALDEKLTGSAGGKYFEEGLKLVKEELAKAQKDYENAKGKDNFAKAL